MTDDSTPQSSAAPPPDESALLEQALAHHQADRLRDAEAIYRTILSHNPRNARAWFGLGSVDARLGRPHEAIQRIERAMALVGPLPEHHHNIAQAKASIGRLAEAEAHFEEAIRVRPRYADAHYNLAGLRTFTEHEGIHLRVERALAEGGWSARERSLLRFALSKLHDDLGRHAEAFAHAMEANRERGAVFDPDQHAEFVDAQIEVFDAQFLARHAASGFGDERFVFIVGMPRSGTTLLEQILAGHSRIHGAGEIPDIQAIASRLAEISSPRRPYPACASVTSPDAWRGFGEAYARHVSEHSPGADRYVNKTPANFLYLGLIRCLLPAARIVHCVRDPRDVALSCYMHNFTNGQEWSFDLSHIAAYYAQYQRVMAHWQAVLAVPVLEVRYEELVADTEQTARRTVAFLGLEWEAGCLRHETVRRPVRTASRSEVRQPIYAHAVGRWQRYRQELCGLIADLETRGCLR